MPPFVGPGTVVWWTRYPVKTRTDPSSSLTGKLTVSSRFGCARSSRTPRLSPSMSAAIWNCRSATCQASSRGAVITAFAIGSRLLTLYAHVPAHREQTRGYTDEHTPHHQLPDDIEGDLPRPRQRHKRQRPRGAAGDEGVAGRDGRRGAAGPASSRDGALHNERPADEPR